MLKTNAAEVGAGEDEDDYYVFHLGSLFTHCTPGALFHDVPSQKEADWQTCLAVIDAKGQSCVPVLLHEASVCLLDIIGLAGWSIVDYDPRWFDEVAKPLVAEFVDISSTAA